MILSDISTVVLLLLFVVAVEVERHIGSREYVEIRENLNHFRGRTVTGVGICHTRIQRVVGTGYGGIGGVLVLKRSRLVNGSTCKVVVKINKGNVM